MKALEGKKTFIGIFLLLATFVINWKFPGQVSREELQALLDQGEKVYEIGKSELWPLVTGLISAAIATYGRIVAKPTEK